MIRNFRHKGLERFFTKGSKAGINPAFAGRLELQLGQLDVATTPAAMGLPGWDLHPLTGKPRGHWSVKVNGNWRLTFRFVGEDAEVVDLQDYH